VTDLSQSVWNEIVKASVYLPAGAKGAIGRYIGLGPLQSILRKRKRTSDQNALLWALYGDVIAQGGEMLRGWTKDDLHEYALGEHFGWTKHEGFGMTRLKPNRRSSRLTKTEFTDFLDAFVRRMAEHGIVLELPGDQSSPGSGSEAGPGMAHSVTPCPQAPVAAVG
jgi:hypothetical protein